MLLYLTTDGCVHCGRMERDTYTQANVARQIEMHFVAAKIHAGKERQFVRKLGVRVFPTTVIISPDAKVIDSMAGYVTAAEFQKRLTAAARPATTR
jgi:thioredoxin-related protein